MITGLRVDNPFLNRPFIFDKKNIQTSLVNETIELRKTLIVIVPEVKTRLTKVLDKQGKVV